MSSIQHPLSHSLVRIHTSDNRIIGAGVLVADGLIWTCAHVVAAALGIANTAQEEPAAAVSLDFPFLSEAVATAHVKVWQPVLPNEQGDIALLRLANSPPSGSHPARLLMNSNILQRRFAVYGFPDGFDMGVWAYGVVRHQTASGWLQVQDAQVPGLPIRTGFSGAPVWDEQGGGVIGIIVAATSGQDKGSKVAFVIPNSVLSESVPLLAESTVYSSSNVSHPDVNPFEYGLPVPPERFWGRSTQRRAVKTRIGGRSAQCLSIVGLRRSGKTSLLHYIQKRPYDFCLPKQRPLIVFLDFQSQQFHTPLGVITGLRYRITEEIGVAPWPADQDDNPEAVNKGLARLRDTGRRLIVLIDEFERIGAYLDQFEYWGGDWRAKASAHYFALVIATSRPLSEIYTEVGLTSPFDNLFTTETLGALTTEEWQIMVHDGFISTGRLVEAGDLTLIDDLAGGMPFFTQMAASLLWEYQDYQDTREAFAEQAVAQFERLWEKLTEGEQRVLYETAGLAPFTTATVSQRIKKEQKALQRYGLLRPDGRLFSSTFAAFLKDEL